MRILTTGSKRIVGKDLIVKLRSRSYKSIFEYDNDSHLEYINRTERNVRYECFHCDDNL